MALKGMHHSYEPDRSGLAFKILSRLLHNARCLKFQKIKIKFKSISYAILILINPKHRRIIWIAAIPPCVFRFKAWIQLMATLLNGICRKFIKRPWIKWMITSNILSFSLARCLYIYIYIDMHGSGVWAPPNLNQINCSWCCCWKTSFSIRRDLWQFSNIVQSIIFDGGSSHLLLWTTEHAIQNFICYLLFR